MNPQASNILSIIPRTIKNFEQNLGDLVKSLGEISVELKKNNEIQERIAKAAEAQAKAQEEQTELAKQMVGRMMNPFGYMGGDDGEDDGENYYV